MLEVKNLSIEFLDRSSPERVLNHFNLRMEQAQIVGLVGESGSGKTMTAQAIAGLLPGHAVIKSGEIRLNGQDLLHCTSRELRTLQGKEISMIFQEPMTSLNPVMKIGRQVEESLRLHTDLPAAERKERAVKAMLDAELPNPEELYHKYPHQLSGGMRQRVMIASAIICHPKLLIADEPTTALDVTIQAQIVRLLQKINRKYGTAILFISHDLGLVRKLCSRVIVLCDGDMIEEGSMEDIFRNPKQDYTRQLIASVPSRTGIPLRRQLHE